MLCSWQWTYWNPWCNLWHLCAIARDAGFHVGLEQLHAFPSTTFNSFCRWVDIVLSKDDIRTLVDVVIVDSTWTDLFPRSYAIQRFIALDAVQAKERSYYNQHLTNQILTEQLKYLVAYTNMLICFYTTVLMPFGAWRGQKAFIFLPWSHFFIKKFWSHYQRCKCLPFEVMR
jgi:hypothetical protein